MADTEKSYLQLRLGKKTNQGLQFVSTRHFLQGNNFNCKTKMKRFLSLAPPTGEQRHNPAPLLPSVQQIDSFYGRT